MKIKLYQKEVCGYVYWCMDVTDYFLSNWGKYFSGLKKAEIVLTIFSDEPDEVKEVCQKLFSKWKTNWMSFDAQKLLLTFEDGTVLNLWNSEWGGIEKL